MYTFTERVLVHPSFSPFGEHYLLLGSHRKRGSRRKYVAFEIKDEVLLKEKLPIIPFDCLLGDSSIKQSLLNKLSGINICDGIKINVSYHFAATNTTTVKTLTGGHIDPRISGLREASESSPGTNLGSF